MKQIVWFSEVGKDDVALVGGKGANLGEMTKAGLPVPSGFIVTADAYFNYVKKTGLASKLVTMLKDVNPEDSKKLQSISRDIKKLIMATPMPKALETEIIDSYQMMGDDVLVAVRSSATAEDLPDASFAGQQATFLNVSGDAEVVHAVQRAYASLFEARAIYYRIINKYEHFKVALAVPVQRMVESDKSGIMFTVDPVTSDLTKIVIEAGWGLGEAIVSGSVTPDRYVVDKATMKIANKELHTQTWKIVKSKQGDKHVNVPKGEQSVQKLSDEEILALAAIAKKIEDHYGSPQDTEWAIEGSHVFMVQSRPVTTLKDVDTAAAANNSAEAPVKVSADLILLKGAPASMGSAFGPVKIIHKPSEIDKVNEGDVLVTEMTTPDFVPAMRRAAGIVTDTGGRTCHAAIVSRELGIPCVVGTGTATSVLKTGQMITVDGQNGQVYKGKVELNNNVKAAAAAAVSGTSVSAESVPVTGTKVYVNLGEPELAEKIAKLPVDGVGLMRAEFIIAGIGEHPRAMLKAGRGGEFTDKLAEGIHTIAAAFAPRPVIYRFTDFKTNEYRNLKGGAEFEFQENNPMIGYRGACRYIREPDVFALEVAALKKVREAYDLKNVHAMIPFVRTVNEYTTIRDMMAKLGLKQSNEFKLWIMVEIPSAVILLDQFCEAGIDGVSIGSNDLTQLTLGLDRDNQVLAAEFDERDDAVVASLEHICKVCRKHNITVSCCGQAPSVFPEITELLVKSGSTSVSVNPDVAVSTRKLVASVEQRLLLSTVTAAEHPTENDLIP
ncbi:MAG: phosphoenolpyruvate synthase [Patescibacteria group bacterium]|jgi:pyruvate,water dikinase